MRVDGHLYAYVSETEYYCMYRFMLHLEVSMPTASMRDHLDYARNTSVILDLLIL